jgi:hypothetical protein
MRDPPPLKRVVHNPMLRHLSVGFLLRQVITEGHKSKHGGGWCTGTSTKLCGAQRKLRGALRIISPTTTKCGHNWRVCCEKRTKHRSHPSQHDSTWWGQCKYCLWAWTPSPSGARSIRWRGCPTLLRARVLLSRSSTPTTGGGLGRLRNFSSLFFSLSL